MEKNIQEAIDTLSVLKDSELTPEQRASIASILDPRAKIVPRKWSRTTNAPYYREHFAREIKKHLDEWEKDTEKDLKFFCSKMKCTRKTLVQRLNQSWLYLQENMDPDGHYTDLRKRTEIMTERDGVRIAFRRVYIPDWSPDKVDKLQVNLKWRNDLHEFIETAKSEDVLKLQGLRLFESDIIYVRELIARLPHFYILSISRSTIQVARMDMPESEKEDDNRTVA